MNLRDLKTKIHSIKSTAKITKAMQMVATSKLKRIRGTVEMARPYSNKINEIIGRIIIEYDTVQHVLDRRKITSLLNEHVPDNSNLFIVVTSNKGLCGAINHHIIKNVIHKVDDLLKNGKEVGLICIGKKAIEVLTRKYNDLIIKKVVTSEDSNNCYEAAKDIVELMISLYQESKVDRCFIFYNNFISMLRQEQVESRLIPLSLEKPCLDKALHEQEPGFIYEPDFTSLLNELIPQDMMSQVYHAILENLASEQASRMTAMDNATNNAKDASKRLTLLYNKTRQANITKELIDIVSGAEAV